jgi:hypothetical protein
VYDVTVKTSYGGFESVPLFVALIRPSAFTLQPGYPADSSVTGGFLSTYKWALTDTCGNLDSGLDGNEQFGEWTDDYWVSTGTHNDWGTPTAGYLYNPGNLWNDYVSETGAATPVSQNPPTPPAPCVTTVPVMHNYPWTFYIGSQAEGLGVPVEEDQQQWYQDCGRHL